MIDKFKKNFIISILIAVVIYLFFIVISDFDNLIRSFSKLTFTAIFIVLSLSLGNYFFRFLKWHYYVKLLAIKLKPGDSLLIFMSGLAMSATPGKVGELLKSYLIKKTVNESISKTAPIVLAERVTDFLSLLFIAILGVYFFDYGHLIVTATSLFFILLIIILASPKIAKIILHTFSKIRPISKYIHNLESAYNSILQMMKIKPLILMYLLSIIAWGFECYGFYFILSALEIPFSIMWASFAYAFSTIIGSITMMPGGLGATEGSLTFLLIREGIEKNLSLAATFITRAATLWFAILLGVISLIFFQRKFGKLEEPA